MSDEQGIIILKAGLVLAFLTPSGKLRLPHRNEIAGIVLVSTAENGVVVASTGIAEGCSFVPARRLQADLDSAASDALADAILAANGRRPM